MNITTEFYRTKEERTREIKPIIVKLHELELNITNLAIKKLYEKMQHFVRTGERTKISIAFPEKEKRIRGVLANNKSEESWVKFEMEKP
jgi:hypothetical protein